MQSRTSYKLLRMRDREIRREFRHFFFYEFECQDAKIACDSVLFAFKFGISHAIRSGVPNKKCRAVVLEVCVACETSEYNQ